MSGTLCYNPSLYLAGLPIDIDPGKVREIFERAHIPTAYTQIVRQKKGVPFKEAVAFIRLDDATLAEKAIELLDGLRITESNTLKVRKYINSFAPRPKPAPRASYHAPVNKVWAAHLAGETSEASQ